MGANHIHRCSQREEKRERQRDREMERERQRDRDSTCHEKVVFNVTNGESHIDNYQLQQAGQPTHPNKSNETDKSKT